MNHNTRSRCRNYSCLAGRISRPPAPHAPVDCRRRGVVAVEEVLKRLWKVGGVSAARSHARRPDWALPSVDGLRFAGAERGVPPPDYAVTFSKAVLNLSISSAVPMVTRTLVGQTGHTRPMITPFCAIACAKSLPGLPTSIMKKLASLGMYFTPFFSRNAKVSWRIFRFV